MDLQGPPRKKMRKGTRSCTECRRRKIRCTFEPGRSNICNECHLRGSICVDQEHGIQESPGILQGEQPYSLRERVTQLEGVVRDILRRMDRFSSGSMSPVQRVTTDDSERASNALNTLKSGVSPAPTESAMPSPSNQIDNAPVLQLFNNQVVTRNNDTLSGNQNYPGLKDLTAKAMTTRAQLLSLLPPCADLEKIVNGTGSWWTNWAAMFPELSDECQESLMTGAVYVKAPDSPPEVAKMVLSILFSIDQLPTDFDFTSLQVPINPKEFTDHCITEIERLIAYDDELASSFSGIECMMMLSKWHMNAGRPRKSWLMNRRALDFGQLTGMHLSTTKPSRLDDKLFERRLSLWSYLVFIDRFLCLLLGLPYAVSDAFFLPQVKLRLQTETTGLLPYCMRLGLVLGQMIDRNQDPSKMSLPTTLRMDQDLEEITRQMPIEFGNLERNTGEADHDFVMVQFVHHYVRSLLHLPLMLKSTNDLRYRYYHDAAVESSRTALMTYKILRSNAGFKPYICKVVDFQAFTVAMLLIIHLLGFSDETPNHSEAQDERDWDLVMATIDVLRNAATERGGTVAEQSAQILATIYNCHSSPFPNLNELSCKITVPYFGVLNISPGRKLSNRPNKGYTKSKIIVPLQTPDQASPDKLFTPPQSSLCDSARSEYSAMDSNHTLCTPPTNYTDEPWFQFVSLPNTGLDMSGSRGLTDVHDLGLWSNMDLDLDLDQGWNLNWSEDGNAIITQ